MMKYWFSIESSMSEKDARAVWSRIAPYKANMTVLFDAVKVYGNADESKIESIGRELAATGLSVIRG